MRSVCLIITVLLIIGCSKDSCREVEDIESSIGLGGITRLEKELFDAEDEIAVLGFLEKYSHLSTDFFYVNEYPSAEILAKRIHAVVNDDYVDTLYSESIRAFERHESAVLSDFELAFQRLLHYYPEIPVPQIQTVVSGLYNDLVVTNENLVIGIDYFIGDTATYRPQDIPKYILKRYTYDYLVPTTMKFVASPLAQLGDENTLLSEMIDHGKVYYLISQLLPCTPDHEIIGFTKQELLDVNANQEIIWASLIENQALYETGEFHKRKFLGERPNVYEIGEKCPGRIGAWVGWQIVQSYMNKTNVSMQEMLRTNDHHSLFAESEYKPRNVN